MARRIQNFDALNTSSARTDALSIVEAAFVAIDTEAVIRRELKLDENILTVGGRTYDLTAFDAVRLIGFGKASCKAVQTVESILRAYIKEGQVIDVRGGVCEIVEISQGSHPRPSKGNVVASENIVNMANRSGERDLVIVVVSGGGSSLLCWPADECDQSARLYEESERAGMTIEEMNTVRKHLSSVKGGGLAQMLQPATVIGLIFCDVPGDHFEEVASGPTYYDASTIEDAQMVIDRYKLTGYRLNDTPKDRSVFERVHNVPMISNTAALKAMEECASKLGYTTANIGAARYDMPHEMVMAMQNALENATAVIAGGEVRLKVTQGGGNGGRCQYMGLEALKRLRDGEIFVPFASDGIDNCSAAGVIADASTREKADTLGTSIEASLQSFKTNDFFETTGDLIMTGQTDANVSDLSVALSKI